MAEGLSTTSYAVLGMLSLRPWTPYELTQQVRRSLAYCWPISERAVYNEPERLVAAGLAAVSVEDGNGRTRRTYSITDRGTRALQDWLRTDPEPPRFFNQALLHLLFADQVDPADLLRSLRHLRDDIAARRVEGAAQIAPYLDGEGPFPHRAHLVALFADLYRRLFEAYAEWADEALAEVQGWENTAGRGLGEHARAQIERAVRSGTAAEGRATPK